jgi:hypothetical protein
MLSRTILMSTLALGALLAIQPAQSQNNLSNGSGAFNPGTGQINRGGDRAVPSATPSAPIPSHEDVRAALLMQDPGTISLGEQPNTAGKAQPETTGQGLTKGEEAGPIASTMQTKPAKFSHRNDAIDHSPIMAMPFPLNEQERQRVFKTVMADEAPSAAATLDLKPADALPYALAANKHPLPLSLSDMPLLSKVDYVKSNDKVYLVSAQTSIVVDLLEGK